ncbi:MAG: sigma-70 family RNA polymerase sigma factor [Pseudomonadota bacterium]|nr:sigma-70 family RNA polymerase sigma factor [Pseudomonadota bacterium]
MTRSAARILDEYLVAAARTGDRKALEMLAERWNRKLIAHAWRVTGHRDLALDAAQAGWVEILRSLPRLQDDRTFPAWAYRIVSRRCSRQINAIVRDRRLAEAAAEEVPAAALAGADSTLDQQRLASAIAALPADQRSAVALFYLEEMSVAQVAVALEIPAGTVKTRLLHARRKLRLALEGEN